MHLRTNRRSYDWYSVRLDFVISFNGIGGSVKESYKSISSRASSQFAGHTRKLVSCNFQYSRKARNTIGQYSFTLKWLGITSLERNNRARPSPLTIEQKFTCWNFDYRSVFLCRLWNVPVEALQECWRSPIHGSKQRDEIVSCFCPWENKETVDSPRS